MISFRRVDPHGDRSRRWLREFAHEAVGMLEVGALEDLTALSGELVGQAVVDRMRCEQPDACVTMPLVIPAEKLPAESSGVLQGTEPIPGVPPKSAVPEPGGDHSRTRAIDTKLQISVSQNR